MIRAEFKRIVVIMGMSLLMSGCAQGSLAVDNTSQTKTLAESEETEKTAEDDSVGDTDGEEKEEEKDSGTVEEKKDEEDPDSGEASEKAETESEDKEASDTEKVAEAESEDVENTEDKEEVPEDICVNGIEDKDLSLLGEDKENETYHLTLLNDTGEGVVLFTVSPSKEDDRSDNYLKEEDSFASGEKRTLCLNDAKEGTLYDIEVTTESKAEYKVEGLPFLEMAEASLKVDDNGLFLIYSKEKDGIKISSIDGKEIVEEVQNTEAKKTSASKKQSKNSSKKKKTSTTDANNNVAPVITPAPAVPDQVIAVPDITNDVLSVVPPVSDNNNVDQGCIGDEGLVY
ncbi:MAG: hypothetical protein K6B28_13860 [Lachnospiraceae bacterium]|nr:hypothetical protein [Lachnospiraceae bacterium]